MQDRRIAPRIECNYPAVVRGKAPKQGKYQREAVARNLSVGGLYLQATEPAEIGSELLVVVKLASESAASVEALSVAARGVVVRTEVAQGGMHGMGIKFERYRFV